MAEKITVTSQELLRRQEEWTAILKQAQESFLAVVSGTEKLPQHFDGNPVRKLQREFISLGKEGMEAFGKLKAHIDKLGGIAAVYEEAERRNTDVTADN